MRPTGRRSTAAALIVLFAACSIEARSTDFECGAGGGCPEGRVCVSGWCVLAGGGDYDDGAPTGGDDGGGDLVDAAPGVCSEADCDLCDNGTCVIRCTQGNSCALPVVCPPGVPCRVECSGTNSCGGGVDCSAASACEIDCGKAMACFGPILCGAGPCDVDCTARDTCFSGVDCSGACACTTDCSGANSCFSAPECPDVDCVSTEGNCTSGADCDSC